jgi:hypothetical protein
MSSGKEKLIKDLLNNMTLSGEGLGKSAAFAQFDVVVQDVDGTKADEIKDLLKKMTLSGEDRKSAAFAQFNVACQSMKTTSFQYLDEVERSGSVMIERLNTLDMNFSKITPPTQNRKNRTGPK